MRILHLTDHYPPALGGIEAHVESLARRQADRGDQVTVLTSSPADADGLHEDDRGPVRVLRVRNLAEGRAVDLAGYDVVQAHLSVVAPFTSPLAARAARRGVPTLVTVHSLWSGMGPVPALAAALAGLRTAPVQWTAVSRVAADQLAFCLPRGVRVHTLPNAVDVAPRTATPGERPDGAVRLISTMRIARRKRPMALLAMLEEVNAAVEVPVQLTVVGDGPLRHRLERRLARSPLRDRVTLTGRLTPAQVTRRLAASDVYVAPAILESFGLAALEARSVGLPVVGRSDSGLTEFIRHGVDGLLAPSDQRMVSQLRELIADPGLRRGIAEHNRLVPSPITWTSTLQAHDAGYARAARHRTTPARPPVWHSA